MGEASAVETRTGKRKAEWFEIDDDHNRYVYVCGLPKSLSEEEFVDLMKKYGIIAKKTNLPGHPFNIKMYKDEHGSFKGDAVCCYVRTESVDLAITYLNEYQYDSTHTLQCSKAKFQMKGSTYDASKKPRAPDKKTKLKQKKTIDKLLSWEPKTASKPIQNKVILKYMFTPEEISEDAELILTLKEDVEAKCNEFNCEPKRIDIHEKHPDGVIEVTFAETAQAETCIKSLNNEYYAGRTVKAELWDGKTKYKIRETDEEYEKRLEKWHEDIQKSDDETDLNESTTKAKNTKEQLDQTNLNQNVHITDTDGV